MIRFALLLAMLSVGSAAIAQPDSDAERAVCDRATPNWSPVRMPPAGINAAIPCSDAELSAYKNANETRKRTDGIAGCERDQRTYLVMYLVNTPTGFFDRFTAGSTMPAGQNFQVEGHRVFRVAGLKDGGASGQQLIEIDGSRAVLMSSSSKVPNDPDYSKITSCFFNTFHFLKQDGQG